MCCTIKYISNFCRDSLGEIKYDPGLLDDFWSSVLNLLDEKGHPYNGDKGCFYCKDEIGTIKSVDKNKLLSDNAVELIYSEVVAPNCAYRYGEQEGVIFFFHTEENNHLFFPHIHASYSGKEIQIALDSGSIIGSLGNRKKEKAALKYVADNKDKMLLEWNRLIKK